MSHSLTFHLETKMLWHQTPSRKKKAVMFTTDNEHLSGQLNAGFSKVFKIFKVCSIKSIKYVREFYTPVCYRVGELWRHSVGGSAVSMKLVPKTNPIGFFL